MSTSERIEGPTPSGGAWSEIVYFDDESNNVDERQATKCAIRERLSDGTMLSETWGTCGEEQS